MPHARRDARPCAGKNKGFCITGKRKTPRHIISGAVLPFWVYLQQVVGYKYDDTCNYYYWDFVVIIRDFLISLVLSVFNGSTKDIRIFQININL